MSKCRDCRVCKYYVKYHTPGPRCELKRKKIKTWRGKQWEVFIPSEKNKNGDCPDYKWRGMLKAIARVGMDY